MNVRLSAVSKLRILTAIRSKFRGITLMANNTIINGGAKPNPVHVGPSPICSFSDGALDAPLKSLIFSIEPKQSGSGDPSPSNIRPITGWSQVDGVAAGKNLLKITSPESSTVSGVTFTLIKDSAGNTIGVKANGTASAVIRYPLNSALELANGTYVISSSGGQANAYCYSLYNGTTFIRDVFNSDQTESRAFSRIIIYVYSGATLNNVSFYPMIRPAGVGDATYERYQGTPITISLGQTVYGGYVDVIGGKLVIDQVKVTLNGTQTISLANWRPTATGVGWFYSQSALGNKVYTSDQAVQKIVSNKLKTVNYATAFGATQDNIVSSVAQANGISSYGLAVRISDTSLTTTAAINAYLTANPIDVVYELATPIEVDLTPVSVSSLLGQNNIWCNTGDTELDYYPAAASLVAVQNRTNKVYVSIPLGKIRYDTYQATPNQALDLDSFRAETGVLMRTVLSHTATKVEFSTVPMTDDEWQSVWAILSAGFNNSRERKLKLRYYDSMSSSYKTGWFYVPDVQFGTRNVDEANGIINYNEIRLAFIEY